MKICSHPECERKMYARGYCTLHYDRLRRRGDVDAPNMTGRHAGNRLFTGLTREKNPQWRGDDVGYKGVHIRLPKERGKASQYLCACGEQASDWSYNHQDPNEKTSVQCGAPTAYSTDLSFYEPLCHPCHVKRDRHQ